MADLKIGIIIGSTRPGRVGDQVGAWVKENAAAEGVEFELVDLHDYALPNLDEALPAGYGQYSNEHTKKWAAKVGEFDGYLIITPEYNHTMPGSLKNAFDFVGAEWNNKAAGVISYGSMGGVRAGEHVRQVLAELQIADVQKHVMFSIFTDFENFSTFKPANELKVPELQAQIAQVVAWAEALKSVREAQAAEAAAA
ncbi:NADPH-dependent FMN reductase [Ruicaihuangia caeni]|uniref:NAD(P)H-dependent oxidoreductase n=1 Tax=Ruicaihuangia caeni TaxID=3042517 RepID=A0AAW6T9H2_9MICO|nr:NAD(P)H-dependent oxidoreductase [Klugiella sp. YN-L-19]MDI2098983.1 NAD(P)H-dependent oxidoreductase [Klugiella sp. YN-L-19]